ncbi:hypothetical protein QBC37DRAFT_300544 [Rhypophila decipiens]|uniref:3'-5' exonuclease domain-containing protein n=1 Tax=Rhypophila decipiens TaxID=261697 RepID=A0AAN7B0N1_9PEZI|nr:hypothetical protein QBC37DRAFT_300544 [Rhypophila decipiens]
MAEIIASLGRINISRHVQSTPDWSIIDTPDAVSHLVDTICLDVGSDAPSQVPALYIDIQTVDDSTQGPSVTLLQIYLFPREHIYLVDVQTLGRQGTFETEGPAQGETLKTILESATIPKVFFDVRTDAEILYHRYGVSLGGVQDLQLMELAARAVCPRPLRHLSSLPRCINRDLNLSILEQITWDKWIALQKKGSQVEMANPRPLSKGSEMMELIGLVVLNVRYLPGLWGEYERRLRTDASHWKGGNETCVSREEVWRIRVEQETKKRVELDKSGQCPLVSVLLLLGERAGGS